MRSGFRQWCGKKQYCHSKAVSKYFKDHDLHLDYLINYDYVCKVVKAFKKDKDFARKMKEIEESNELFASCLEKENLAKLKALKFASNFKLKLLYNRNWKLFKFFAK